MLKSFLFLVSLILGMAIHCYSQNFEWVKSFGGSGGENYPLCIQSKDNSYLAWSGFFNTKFGSFSKMYNGVILCVGKLDNTGNPQWLWTPDSIIGAVSVRNISYDSINEKIYIVGRLRGKFYINNKSYVSFYSNSLNKFSDNSFIIKLNQSGVLEKVLIINDSNHNTINSLQCLNGNLILTLSIQINNTLDFCGVGIPCINKSGILLCKFDKDLNLIEKSSLLECINSINENIRIISGTVFLFTYASGVQISDSINFINNSDGYYAIEFSSKLKVKLVEKLYWGAFLLADVSISENHEIIVSTAFSDSIVFKNKIIRTDKYFRPTILIYNKDYNLKNCIYPKVILDNFKKPSSQYFTSLYHNGYVYAGGNIMGDFKFGDISTYNYEGRVFVAKLDLKGNFLWVKRFSTSTSYQYINNIDAHNKEILFCGVYADTTNIDSQQFISAGSLDIIVAKIHDIDILRGYVYHGPYCAGDTIKIPYTKNGDFNKSNQFIAQLSDENGNFEGGERELGRITSDTDGVIKGILPMFDVQSSPNYRIRIISTNPVVQSYYKYDTLRLLIYSKDTANAGADTTICNGQSVQLSTTGGSLWRWSPGNLVSDSTTRKTITYPNGTTTYRVIISDSSGCGKTDTAYKTVYVRPPLKNLTSDTVLCKDSKTLLKIKPTGGIGKNYSYKWFGATGQELANTDTLRIKANSEGSLMMILGDNCSINDTSQMNITFPVLNFKQIQSKDTLVCTNNSAFLQIKPSPPKQSDYSYRWLDFNGNTLSQNDTMSINITKTDSFKTILTYLCNAKSDTTIMRVLLPQQLIIKINKPACFDSSITLSVNATGGYKNILTHVWYRAGKPIDIGKTISLNGIKTKLKITVKSSDYCKTSMKDSLELIPMPKAIIKLTKDTICENDSLTIQNQSTSFTKLVSYLSWESNKTILLNKDTAITLKNTGLQYIKLNITDSIGCTTSDSAKMQVIPKPDASFYITPQNPTVDNGSIELSPKNKDYIEYIWQISNDLIIKHRYWSIVRLPVFDTATYNAILIVKNKYACKDTVSQTIKIAESDAFYIPNAISNNNDGLNDEFAPYGWKVESYQMLIVARTNQVVYKGSTPWKPTIEDGVYSYIIKVKFKDGSQKTFKGLVHVLR